MKQLGVPLCDRQGSLPASRLTSHLMLTVAGSCTSRAEVSLVVYPAMMVATALEGLMEAATNPGGDRWKRMRQAVQTLGGGPEVLEETAATAEHHAKTYRSGTS